MYTEFSANLAHAVYGTVRDNTAYNTFSLVNPENNICKSTVDHIVVRAWSMQTRNIQMSKFHTVHASLGDTNENKNKSTQAKRQQYYFFFLKKSLPPRMAVMITFLFYSFTNVCSKWRYIPRLIHSGISEKVYGHLMEIFKRAE